MDRKDIANDKELRDEMMRHAPQPSDVHNELVMNAARVRAAAERRNRQRDARRRGLWALAATVVLAVGVWQSFPDAVHTDANVRNDATGDAWPAGNISLDRFPGELRWDALPGAQRYRVTLFDDAAQSLWQSDWLDEPRLVTTDVDGPVELTGRRLFWVVELDGSTSRQSLGPYWFRVK